MPRLEPDDNGGERLSPDPPTADDVVWAIDAVLGAASLFAKTVGAVGSSAPGRLAAGATRRLTRPLAREGQGVRGQLEEEASPTAKRIVAQVTPQVMDVVDLDVILDAADLNAILDHIDMDRLLARVDLDAVLERLDLNQIVERIDIGALLERIDVDAIVSRVDIDGIVERIDVGAVVRRVDINAIMADLDVEELVGNTEIGSLLAKSTSSVASTALDSVRSQGVSLDAFVGRWVNRLVRRDPAGLPAGPPLLLDAAPKALTTGSSAEGSA